MIWAIASAYRQYFRFSGRASRPEFWWWGLYVMLVGSALMTASAVAKHLPTPGNATVESILDTSFLVFLATSFIPNYALIFRRLHDVGRSGWLLIIIFLPVIGLVLLIYWLCLPGSQGPNGFGVRQG
jgi:uncharacterized membrane protein YhaH (DUF805 family)